MADGDFLKAERLLAALRADGGTVAAEGDRLIVQGALTDARRAAIIARKPELLALLAAESASVVELADDDAGKLPLTAPQTALRGSLLAGFAMAEADPIPPPAVPPESTVAPPPESTSPPPPRGPVVAGAAVMTPELFRWRALRDRAICRGERFNEPPPRYCYPEFEPDEKRRRAILGL